MLVVSTFKSPETISWKPTWRTQGNPVLKVKTRHNELIQGGNITCCQTWPPGLCGRRRELTPVSCSLSSMCAMARARTHTHTHTHTHTLAQASTHVCTHTQLKKRLKQKELKMLLQ